MPWIEGEVMSVEQVKNEKTGKFSAVMRILERVGNPTIYSVRDYENRPATVGQMVKIHCWLDVYQGKRGPAVAWLMSKVQPAVELRAVGGSGGKVAV